MPNDTPDKWFARLDTLIKLMDIIEHGKAVISWQDKNVIKIEKIETNAEIKK